MDEADENHQRCMHCGRYANECQCDGGVDSTVSTPSRTEITGPFDVSYCHNAPQGLRKMDRDKFMLALDLHQPDWWIQFATQQDLRDYVRVASRIDNRELNHAKEALRRHTAARLETPVRASMEITQQQ